MMKGPQTILIQGVMGKGKSRRRLMLCACQILSTAGCSGCKPLLSITYNTGLQMQCM